MQDKQDEAGRERQLDLNLPQLDDEDVIQAMKEVPGYLDITPGDFRRVYGLALKHALDRLTHGKTAAQVMTREVATVSVDDTLDRVAKVMAEKKVSGVPVLQDGIVAGIISERDFLMLSGVPGGRHFMAVLHRCLSGRACVAAPLKAQKAGEVMSRPPITVGPDTPVWGIWEMLAQEKINRVPVVDDDGRLLGMVSRGDLLGLFNPAWDKGEKE